MASSQNGYRANDRSVIDYARVPGSTVGFNLRKGDVTRVLLYLAQEFDDHIEDLDTAGTYQEGDAPPAIPGGSASDLRDDWSYAERPIRGSSTTLSNHASGTAVDLNAAQHPLGRTGTFTSAQVEQIRDLLHQLVDPVTKVSVVRWGGLYSGRKDEMHFEINAGLEAVGRVADLVSSVDGKLVLKRPAQPKKPKRQTAPDFPLPDGHWYGPESSDEKNHSGYRAKDRAGIRLFQAELDERDWKIDIDGRYGKQTEDVVKHFQRDKGLKDDGLCGAKTWRAIWEAPIS